MLTGIMRKKATLKEAKSDSFKEHFNNIFKTNKKENINIYISYAIFEKTKSVQEGFWPL